MIRSIGNDPASGFVRRTMRASGQASVSASAGTDGKRDRATPALPVAASHGHGDGGFRDAVMDGAAREGRVGRADLLFEVQRLAQVGTRFDDLPERATDAVLAYRDALDRMSMVLLPDGRRPFGGLRA